MLKPISEERILERLCVENPWWMHGSIDEDIQAMQRRLYFSLFYPLVQERDVRRAVVLMGPRRVGKTVMMYHAIHELLQHTHRQNVCFISIDNPIYLHLGLEDLFRLAMKAVSSESAQGWYVFFDEIQYLKHWEQHLKVLVDSYPQTKFIVSGSAAAALKMQSAESGAGRFTEFMLPPLTFQEYLHLKQYEYLIKPTQCLWQGNTKELFTTINTQELNNHFLDYINYGGYPELIFSEKMQSNLSRYVKSDIIDKVLLRDLPSLYGIQDVQELNAFFSTLVYYSGQEVSLEALSKSSGVDKPMLKKYLAYLEAAFLIRVVHRIDDTAKRFQRATFYKIYLTNPSLRSAIFSPISATDDSIGAMVETAIFAQWMHEDWFTPWYARWTNGRVQGEVDLVGLDRRTFKPQWAVEIKWSNRYLRHVSELKSLLNFCTKQSLSSALVTTIDKEATIVHDGITIHFVPAALYAYAVGANSLRQKSQNGTG